MNDPYNTTSISKSSSSSKESEENSKLLENVTNSKQEDLTHSETKRDVSVAEQEENKDNRNSQTNFGPLETPEINEYFQEEADILGNKDDSSPTKNSPELTNTQAVEDKQQIAPQTLPDKDFNSFQPTVSLPTATKRELGHLTLQSPNTLTSAAQTQLIVPGSMILSSFIGTIAAVLLLGVIGLLIYLAYKKCGHKMFKRYKSSGTLKPGEGEGKYIYSTSNLLLYLILLFIIPP